MNALGRWSAEEEATLTRGVQEHGQGSWVAVGKMVGRTPPDCLDHWKHQMASGKGTRKGSWSEKEKRRLEKYVGKYGQQWTAVSQKVGRTEYQCREKW